MYSGSARGWIKLVAIAISLLYIALRIYSADPGEVVASPLFEQWPGTSQEASAPAAPAEPDAGEKPPSAAGAVDIQTWLEKSALNADNNETAELRITITNRSSLPVENIKWIAFSMPGLVPAPQEPQQASELRDQESNEGTGRDPAQEPLGCWSEQRRPACVSEDTPSGLPEQIAANSSLTVRARLGPGQIPGQFSAGGLIGWKHGELEEVRAFQAGPVRVWTHPKETAKALVAALETLAIPALLAGLAWWFENRQRSRDLAGEVWKAEIPRIHQHAEKYYMPMVRNLRRFLPAWDRWREDLGQGTDRAGSMNKADFREAVYQYLMFRRRVQRLKADKSSLFFKNEPAETLAAILVTTFLNAAAAEQVLEQKTEKLIERLNQGPSSEPRSSESTLERLMSVFVEKQPAAPAGGWGDPYEDPPISWFWSRIDSDPEWTQDYKIFAAGFADWLERWTRNPHDPKKQDDYDERVWALRAIREILSFETNRPFQKVWYEREDQTPNTGLFSNTWLRLENWLDPADRVEFKEKCAEYVGRTKPDKWTWDAAGTAQPL